MPPLSPELLKQIEAEANAYCRKKSRTMGAQSWEAYKAGATAYAHYKEEAERYRKALLKLQDIPAPYTDYGVYDEFVDTIRNLTSAALNPPAGDNTKTEKDGE